MEIQINYHEVNAFIQLKSTFEEILDWTINKLSLPVTTLDIILTSDSYLKQLHKDFFDLDSKTDVITFDLNESPNEIEGEIYISVERAIEQSKTYKVSPEIEICRLLIHGCLHLAGYDDLNESDLSVMKKEENELVEKVSRIYNNKLHVGVN
jgi:probable rRNA maturation factor